MVDMQKISIDSERAIESIKMLLQEANILRIYQGKSFLSHKDIKKAWYIIEGIYNKDLLDRAEKWNKYILKSSISRIEIDKIINDIIPNNKTDIKIRSMQYIVSKSTRIFIYNLVRLMETNYFQKMSECHNSTKGI